MCEKKQKIILMLLLSVMCTLGAQDLVHLKLKATRYHSMFENRRTSNGDIFSSKKYTAAHKNIKLGTFVLVVDTVTDKWVVVKINDRCPRKNVIDLSGIAADRIGLTLHKGVARVLVTILPDEAEAIWLQQESMHDKYDKILAKLSNNAENKEDSNKEDSNKEDSNKEDSNKIVVHTAPSPAPQSRQSVTRVVKPAKHDEEKHAKDTVPVKFYIYYIENTDIAEDIIEELHPSVAQNSKIINDNIDSIKIEILMTEGVEKFENKFRKKYPQYTILKNYNFQK